MKQVIEVDENGLFVEDVILSDDADTTGFITVMCPGGFYRPKWDGQKWVEGATTDYIQSLQPSQTDQIKAQLLDLDTVLPRCVEDLIAARSVDVTILPQIMQDRLKQKQDLRVHLQQLNAK